MYRKSVIHRTRDCERKGAKAKSSTAVQRSSIFGCRMNSQYPAELGGDSQNLGSASLFPHKKGEIMATVKPIPDGYHSVTPYLYVKGAVAAIDFYKEVFGATELMRALGPNGKIMHAELKFGDSIVMLADEEPTRGVLSPLTVGGFSVGFHLYVKDSDAIMKKALEKGAKELHPMKNQFYGDRSGSLLDPFGHMWSVATHVEDVSPEELKKRMVSAMSQSAGA